MRTKIGSIHLTVAVQYSIPQSLCERQGMIILERLRQLSMCMLAIGDGNSSADSQTSFFTENDKQHMLSSNAPVLC